MAKEKKKSCLLACDHRWIFHSCDYHRGEGDQAYESAKAKPGSIVLAKTLDLILGVDGNFFTSNGDNSFGKSDCSTGI